MNNFTSMPSIDRQVSCRHKNPIYEDFEGNTPVGYCGDCGVDLGTVREQKAAEYMIARYLHHSI